MLEHPLAGSGMLVIDRLKTLGEKPQGYADSALRYRAKQKRQQAAGVTDTGREITHDR